MSRSSVARGSSSAAQFGDGMLMLDGQAIAALTDLDAVREVTRDALIETSCGRTRQPLRQIVPLPGGGDRSLSVMFGAMEKPATFGAKVVSVFHDNPAEGFGSHLGAVLLFEPRNGRLVAVMDAAEITALRTAAASAVATDALADPGASTLTVLGTGEQARRHLQALARVRRFTDVRIWGRSREKAQALRPLASALFPDGRIGVIDNVEEAVRGAAVVCTVSSAKTPILQGNWLAAGTHVNLVGSSVRECREVDGEVLRDARIFVDYMPMALSAAGELGLALEQEQITDADIAGEIGEVLAGRIEGRSVGVQRTVYKSLGLPAQDLALAHWLASRARLTRS